MRTVLLGVAALPLWVRVATRRVTEPWWTTAPARLAATAIAMLAWVYWSGSVLDGRIAALVAVLGWLVLAAETATHPSAGPADLPDRHPHRHHHRARRGGPPDPAGTSAPPRCSACGTPLVSDRIPTASASVQPGRPTRARTRP